jgi:hypothetical protein
MFDRGSAGPSISVACHHATIATMFSTMIVANNNEGSLYMREEAGIVAELCLT